MNAGSYSHSTFLNWSSSDAAALPGLHTLWPRSERGQWPQKGAPGASSLGRSLVSASLRDAAPGPREAGPAPCVLADGGTAADPETTRSPFLFLRSLWALWRRRKLCPVSTQQQAICGGWASTGWSEAGRGLAVVASPSLSGLPPSLPTRGQQKARAGAGEEGGLLRTSEKPSFHFA